MVTHQLPLHLVNLSQLTLADRDQAGFLQTNKTVIRNEAMAYNKQSKHNCLLVVHEVVIHNLGRLLDGLTPYACVYPRLHH